MYFKYLSLLIPQLHPISYLLMLPLIIFTPCFLKLILSENQFLYILLEWVVYPEIFNFLIKIKVAFTAKIFIKNPLFSNIHSNKNL